MQLTGKPKHRAAEAAFESAFDWDAVAPDCPRRSQSHWGVDWGGLKWGTPASDRGLLAPHCCAADASHREAITGFEGTAAWFFTQSYCISSAGRSCQCRSGWCWLIKWDLFIGKRGQSWTSGSAVVWWRRCLRVKAGRKRSWKQKLVIATYIFKSLKMIDKMVKNVYNVQQCIVPSNWGRCRVWCSVWPLGPLWTGWSPALLMSTEGCSIEGRKRL